MATAKTKVGFVASSQGNAIARDQGGNERTLNTGDAVYLRDTLVTSSGDQVSVTMINGPSTLMPLSLTVLLSFLQTRVINLLVSLRLEI